MVTSEKAMVAQVFLKKGAEASSDQGPNGPIIPELLRMFPGAPLIRRTTGTISAWDYPEFVAAIDSFESKTTKAVQKAS